ncbi:MAG: hypothetical protein QM655_14775, partial [Nocardioidaceae bacterium]
IGREDLGGQYLDPHRGVTLLVEDRTLAFTVDEAVEVLAERGVTDVDASHAVQATGGWITGILFELWRYAGHEHGSGGEADPLSGYLSNEIMAALSAEQQDALVRTSLLDEVTPPRAEALGVSQAGEVLYSLSRRHLPVDFNPAMTALRCHPRFREYLQERLGRLPDQELRSLRRAHARLLVAERRHEDAVEEFLAAADLEGAAEAAALTVDAVLERLDFGLAERWLDAIGTAGVRRWPQLVAAAVRVACEAERYGEGAGHADRLLSSVDRDDPVLTPVLVTTIAWCYFLVSRIEDALRLLDAAPDVSEIRMMRFCIGIELLDDPTHYRDRPPDCDGPADGLLIRADLAHGRFARVLETRSRPWAAIELGRVGALRSLGRTAEAARLMESLPSTTWTAVRTRAEIMADTAQPEQAYAALLQGRDRLARSGSNLYRMFSLLFEASLALRLRRDTSFATAALNEVEREPSASRRARIVEQLHLWRGLAALIEGRDDEAVTQLRLAVAVMTTWDRLLFLPAAATYLAEAEWRTGDPDRADAAADLALATAVRQGSHHLLLLALREFPAVVSRRLDAEVDPDSTWHALGRSVLHHELVDLRTMSPRVTALDLGEQAIEVEGKVVVPKLVKSVELLSFLASRGGRVSKAVLVDHLFESSSAESASAYFRMALNGLRKVLPPDAPLGLDGSDLLWLDDSLSSVTLAVEASAAAIPNLPFAEQRAAVQAVIEQLAGGEFLPQSRSEWVAERRERLASLHTEMIELDAHLAFGSDDFRTADARAVEALERDSLRERSWRLRMRVAAALGDRDRVTSLWRGCVAELARIGAEPEDATTVLARNLRGEPSPRG